VLAALVSCHRQEEGTNCAKPLETTTRYLPARCKNAFMHTVVRIKPSGRVGLSLPLLAHLPSLAVTIKRERCGEAKKKDAGPLRPNETCTNPQPGRMP